MTQDVFLILHGWGGNKPAHWQEHLVGKLTAEGCKVHYPKMPDPAAPNLEAWVARLAGEMREIREQSPSAKLTVLAHSLGGINWLHYVSRRTADDICAERVLLVAPPYVIPEAPPVDAPPGVPGFFPPPLSPAAVKAAAGETVIVASDNDDYATFDLTGGYAAKLEVPIEKLPGGGHISPYYGYGEWPWVYEWCMRRASLPPMPREGQ